MLNLIVYLYVNYTTMYKKNKYGFYVYPDDVYYINNIHWSINSISYTDCLFYRLIDNKIFGIELYKTN